MSSRPRQVLPGVELFPALTPTLPPATHTNSYALGTREVLLVEPATPYDDERRAWLEWVRGLSSTGRTPLAIFLTHHHPDHVGGATFLARELELPLWAHAATEERLGPAVPIARRVQDDELLQLAGPTPQVWRALHTPGHAPGHLCLYEEELGAVVVGDMVASEGTILIEPVDGDMQSYLEQLKRLSDLRARVALPAHGGPIDEPTKLFHHYVAHRLAREAKVMAALEKAPPSGAPSSALVPLAYADTNPALWPLAALSLEAHLIKLEREGRAARAGAGWRPAR
jgi:glyoxylase-like metal-dependent hydrolase (beta-lactamase superfamily II)